MDFEAAFQLIDAAIFTKTGRHLSAPEVTILRGTWEGITYEQMAETSQYSLNYLMRDIGPKFWRLLSDVLEEEVSKTNVRSVLERHRRSPSSPGQSPDQSGQSSSMSEQETSSEVSNPESLQLTNEGHSLRDWSEAPDVSIFYDRSKELATLKQWIVKDGCRLVALQGLSGVGKTALASKLGEEIQNQFEAVIWRSLNRVPTLKVLLDNLLKLLPQTFVQADGEPVSQLMASLRARRCLLILDGLESVLQTGQLAGRYREGYEDYGELLRRVGEESHQSCLLITSLENPREIALRSGETSPVRSFTLSGLQEEGGQEILKAEGLVAQENWRTLINQYQGNPSALKIAANLIRELFNGNVAEFLERETFVFGDIGELLAPLLGRLSDLEKEVLCWLAIERQAISFSTLQANITLAISEGELLEVLSSLGQRSLIETKATEGKSLFALQPMVMEYVTSQLIEQISGKVPAREKSQRRQLSLLEETIELTPSAKKPAHLSQWFENRFEEGWQPLEALLAKSKKLSPRLRSTYHLRGEDFVRRFKPLHLETPSHSQAVALLVAIAKEAEQKVGVRVQVQPMGEETFLPANLKLSLLNDSGEMLREVQSQSQDHFIQLPYFRGEPKERFSIQVALASISLTEDFVI